MQVVASSGVRAALAAALDGGPAFAPAPTDAAERDGLSRLLATGSARAGTAVVVATSGSTGTPKGVELSAAAIRASATATHERLGGPRDWLLALPTHYVAGLMVLARAAVGGTAVVPVGADLAGLPAAPVGAYLSVVATQLRRGLASPETTAALARCAAVLLGGGPADPELLAAARAAGVPVVTTYGMSETCGGCCYDGVPLDGVSVGLEGERITLDGPVLFSGYWGGADATRPWRTADRGAWVDGRLRVLGRVDDVVISGGMNVDLAAVQRVADGWPAEVAVVGVSDAEWGTAVVAVVAGRTDGLREWLADRLPSYAVPRSVVERDRLPRTAGGKIDRRALIASLTREDPR